MEKAREWESLHRITVNDLINIVASGIRDFRAAPLYGLAFAGLYVAAGWLILALLLYLHLPFLAYPMAMGFALVAPFAAVGFYAVSASLEKNEKLSWRTILAAMGEAARRDLRWMALVTGFALVLWLDIAAFLLFALMGFKALTPALIGELFTTPTGLVFVILGNATGALIAFSIFSISVISFPMLFDRDVDFVTAMVASVRLVTENPATMIGWCAFIGLLTGISIVSGFLGLFLVMPIIGHATWHLYRRAMDLPG